MRLDERLALRLYPAFQRLPDGARARALRDARLEVLDHGLFPVFLLAAIVLSGVALVGALRLIGGVVESGALVALAPFILIEARFGWLLWRRTINESVRNSLTRCGHRFCDACNYEIGSNASPFCPECGNVVPKTKPPDLDGC